MSRISSAADGLQLYNSEDVSVGVWLSPYEAERRHNVRFDMEFVSQGCRNVYIVSHKQSIDDMRRKDRTLKRAGHSVRGSIRLDCHMPLECGTNQVL